jgi:uncharacterized protein
MTTADVVNAFLQRLDDGDLDGVAQLFAEEIDWYVPGHDAMPWTGGRSRRAEVPEFFLTLESQFEPAQSNVSVEKIVIDGSDAVVFATFQRTFAKTGRSFTNPEAMLLEVCDGKIVKMHLYEDTAIVRDAFFAEPA